uniref:DUF4371 domain-containing protein n=1 Tax=Amphimedon queenslandica TaxID=400682 RepID=A0A1X7V068_AMPQE
MIRRLDNFVKRLGSDARVQDCSNFFLSPAMRGVLKPTSAPAGTPLPCRTYVPLSTGDEDEEEEGDISRSFSFPTAYQIVIILEENGISLDAQSPTGEKGVGAICQSRHDDSFINVGNFLSFLKLHSRHIELLQSRMTSGPKNATLHSHDYQNSMLSILAKSVLDYIINEVKEARYFTIMIDETKDISKKEQLTLILRYVLKGVIHERFISYSNCEELNAAALTSYIYDVLTKNGLNIADCVSQCYNGASVISGSLTGVRTRILEDNPKAVYIHCHAHQLNLALVDCCHSLSFASDFLALLESLCVFMSSSVPHSILL